MKRHVCALLVAIWAAPAFAVPLLQLPDLYDDDRRAGGSATLIDFGTLTYDATADRLSFVSNAGFDYASHYWGDWQFYDGVFAWTAGVDSRGRVTDPGSMLWLGDFGSGMEVLAEGRLLKLGNSGVNEVGEGWYVWQDLQALFGFDYLDPRLSAMEDQALLLFNVQMVPVTQNLFDHDFMASANFPVECEGLRTSCEPWSNTGLISYEVPEPSTFVLFGFGLAGLGFATRRRAA